MIGLIVILGILCVLNVVLVIWLIISLQKIGAARESEHLAVRELADFRTEFAEYEGGMQKRLVAARKDAIARSTSVVKGKVAEQLVPFAANFGFNVRDCRFLGAPFDFLVLDGMTEGDLERIVFVEVKTGKGRLSRREQQIRNALKYGEHAFMICHVMPDGSVQWSS